MGKVYLDTRTWNSWMKDRFLEKDFITLDELLGDYEDLIFELEKYEKDKSEDESDIGEIDRVFKSARDDGKINY